MSDEKFCLKWDDFQNNVTTSFQELRNDLDFCDVTLASEGNQQIKAHKVILSASSPFFMEMLRSNKHVHGLIYMRGITYKDLAAIVDYIYHGYVNIYQEDLENFLRLGEELQLKGLSDGGSRTNDEKKYQDQLNKEIIVNEPNMRKIKQAPERKAHNITDCNKVLIENFEGPWETESFFESMPHIDNTMVPVNDPYVISLNKKIEAMIEKVNGSWICKICGKNDIRNNRTDYKRHAEKHLEGIYHPCSFCGKSFRLSNTLRVHIQSIHK